MKNGGLVPAADLQSIRGWAWGDGRHQIGFNTVLSPNSPSCIDGNHRAMDGGAPVSASSYHPGGVNCLFGDGSVHFIPETIDSGDPTSLLGAGAGGTPWYH